MRRNSYISRQSSRLSAQSSPTVEEDDMENTVPSENPGLTVEIHTGEQNIEAQKKTEESEPVKWTKEKIFTVVTFCLANFSVGAYYSILGPFFPQEAAAKGMSSTLTGIVFSEFELIIIVMSPIYGAYLTKIGAKHLYISGLLLSGGSAVLFGLLEYCPPGTIFTVMCILVRTVEALGTAGYITASFAILANTFRDRVSTMMGNLELFSGLGLMVGPPIGGILYQFGGFKLPFIITGAMNLVIALFSLCILPSQSDLRQTGSSSMRSLLKMPVILLMILTVFAGTCCIGFTDVALALRLDSVYDFTPFIIGLIFLVGPGIYAITTPVWGYMSDKWPRNSILFILLGYILAGSGFILMGPAPFFHLRNDMLWLLLCTLGLMGIGVGSLVASFQVMTSAAIQSGMPENLDTYGAISGLFTLAFSLGAFTGPLLGGYLIDVIGFAWGAFVFGCMVFLCVVILGIYLSIASPCTKPPVTSVKDSESGPVVDETSPLLTNRG